MDQLQKFSDKLLEYLNSAEVFMQEQVPDFVSQFVAYEAWKAEWLLKVAIAVLLILVIIQIIVFIAGIRADFEDGFPQALCVIGLAGTLSLSFFVSSYTDVKKLEIAPKVYMIERAKELVTK